MGEEFAYEWQKEYAKLNWRVVDERSSAWNEIIQVHEADNSLGRLRTMRFSNGGHSEVDQWMWQTEAQFVGGPPDLELGQMALIASPMFDYLLADSTHVPFEANRLLIAAVAMQASHSTTTTTIAPP